MNSYLAGVVHERSYTNIIDFLLWDTGNRRRCHRIAAHSPECCQSSENVVF